MRHYTHTHARIVLFRQHTKTMTYIKSKARMKLGHYGIKYVIKHDYTYLRRDEHRQIIFQIVYGNMHVSFQVLFKGIFTKKC